MRYDTKAKREKQQKKKNQKAKKRKENTREKTHEKTVVQHTKDKNIRKTPNG